MSKKKMNNSVNIISLNLTSTAFNIWMLYKFNFKLLLKITYRELFIVISDKNLRKNCCAHGRKLQFFIQKFGKYYLYVVYKFKTSSLSFLYLFLL